MKNTVSKGWGAKRRKKKKNKRQDMIFRIKVKCFIGECRPTEVVMW